MPYRVPAENDAARLEAEEFRRDLASMRTMSVTDGVRIAAVGATLLVVLGILYGTFHRHADLSTDGAQDPHCHDIYEISTDGTSRPIRICSGFGDRGGPAPTTTYR